MLAVLMPFGSFLLMRHVVTSPSSFVPPPAPPCFMYRRQGSNSCSTPVCNSTSPFTSSCVLSRSLPAMSGLSASTVPSLRTPTCTRVLRGALRHQDYLTQFQTFHIPMCCTGPGTGSDPFANYRQKITTDPTQQLRSWQLQQLQARVMVLEQQAKSAATATSKTQREVRVACG